MSRNARTADGLAPVVSTSSQSTPRVASAASGRVQRKRDHADVQSVDREEMHRAAMYEKLILLIADLVLLAEHHRAKHGGERGPLCRDAGAEPRVELAGGVFEEHAVPVRRLFERDNSGPGEPKVHSRIGEVAVKRVGR